MLWPIAAAVIFVLWSALSGRAQVQQSTTWLIYGMLALSLTFVWGKAGVFSFAQAAFFGIGAYVYCLTAGNIVDVTRETVSAVLIAVAVSALVAAGLGYVVFYGRLGPLPVAVVTLAFSLVLVTILGGLADPSIRVGDVPLGGYNGISGVPLTFPGLEGTLAPLPTLVLIALLAAAAVYLLKGILRRPFGRVVVATAVNPDRAELLGYNVRNVKLRAFMVGGGLAGLAGALYAATVLYTDPSVFGLSQAALVVVWAMVGGRTSLAGAFVGVLIVEPLTSVLGSAGGDLSPIVLGLVLIVVVLVLPTGIVPSLGALIKRLHDRRRSAVASEQVLDAVRGPFPVPSNERGGATLSVAHLSKRYGGLEVTRDVSLTFDAAEIHSIVGPNGAGKSTLFGLLMGYVQPNDGTIRLGDDDITRLPVFVRARRGLALKRQIASVFMDLPVRENLWLAVYADDRSASAATARAAEIESWLGLGHAASFDASQLAHGHRQLLEIGMALATRPRVLLLDEPTAGMTTEETRAIARLIRSVASHLTVIVVEHDMEFIRDLGAPVTVLDRGAILTRGTIDELRSDERVLNVYLGRAHA
ncbi:ATP-binding cassette domain-containing protein [Microbacterium pseudoresistens]